MTGRDDPPRLDAAGEPSGDGPGGVGAVEQESLGAVNPSTALAGTVVDELVRGGVRHVVLAPGSRSTALAVAVARRDDVELHVRHDERSAAFLALGLARGDGRPAAVVTTSGTAVANLGPAVAEAHTAGVPLVVVSADRPVELHHVGANQAFAQADLFRELVRWHLDLPAASGAPGEPGYWRSATARLVAAARGRPGAGVVAADAGGSAGPVHANLAFREPTVPGLDDGRTRALPYRQVLAGRTDGQPWTRFGLPSTAIDPDLVARLQALVAGRRVLVVAGDGPTPAPALAALRRSGVPVLAEPTVGGPRGVGTPHLGPILAAMGDDPAWRPDLVLRLGRPTLSRAALVGLSDVETVQVTEVGVTDPTRTVAHAVTAPAGPLVAALVAAGLAQESNWSQRWRDGVEVARGVVAGHLDGRDAPEPAVARRVSSAVGDRPLVVASSLPIRDLADYADAAPDAAPDAGPDAGEPVGDPAGPASPTGPGRVLANRGLAGIDGFTSTAVGVALASGPTVALAGDLSFLHDHNGLLVPDVAAVPLVLVVVDNDGGGIFHQVPAHDLDDFERLFATPHGRDLVAVAEAAGVPAMAVDVDEVAEVVAHPPTDGMQVVVVRTDRQRGAAARAAIRDDLAGKLADG